MDEQNQIQNEGEDQLSLSSNKPLHSHYIQDIAPGAQDNSRHMNYLQPQAGANPYPNLKRKLSTTTR